jgi:hypothetical protein
MVRLFLTFILFFVGISLADDKVSKFESMVDNYVKQNFKEFEIINMVKIPESYIKQIPEDFDSVECKSKGNSGLYLYLSCFTYKDGKQSDEIPVTYRISQLNKDGSLTPVIHKNQKVNILYINGSIKIQLLGTALESGRVGSYIKVKNISTGKELIGKVIDQQTVLVEGE